MRALDKGTRVGSYLLEDVLGRGGFGITYLARDTRLDRHVALKELAPAGCLRQGARVVAERPEELAEAVSRFLEEARILARFRHAGIVTVYDMVEENGTAYMAMELLDGEPLTGRAPLSSAEAIALVLEAARALEAVHAQGVLHRDVTPDNLIQTSRGLVLVDFGSARAMGRPATAMATPGFGAPEQHSARAAQGAFTDVYGLAATLHFLLTGEPPRSAVDRAAGAGYEPPERCNAAVRDALRRGMELESRRRPQDVSAFLALLLGAGGWTGGTCRRILQGHAGHVHAVALAADARLMATGGEDRTARLWDVESGREVARLTGHEGWVSGVAFSSDPAMVATVSLDGGLRLWDVSEGALRGATRVRGNLLCVACVGHLLATGGQDRVVRLWDADGLRVVAETERHAGVIYSVAPWGPWLVSAAGLEPFVRRWRVPSLAEADRADTPRGARSLSGSADARLAAARGDGAVAVFGGFALERVIADRGARSLAVAMSDDGRRVATGDEDGVVRLWDADDGRLLAELGGHRGEVLAVALRGTTLASASSDATVRLWELA